MAVLRRRPGDIDLTQRFDMTGLPERKPKKERQDLKDIWKALGGLPAIRVTPEMIIDLVEQRLVRALSGAVAGALASTEARKQSVRRNDQPLEQKIRASDRALAFFQRQAGPGRP